MALESDFHRLRKYKRYSSLSTREETDVSDEGLCLTRRCGDLGERVFIRAVAAATRLAAVPGDPTANREKEAPPPAAPPSVITPMTRGVATISYT